MKYLKEARCNSRPERNTDSMAITGGRNVELACSLSKGHDDAKCFVRISDDYVVRWPNPAVPASAEVL